MNTCALTRLLWPAFLVGLLVGSLAGNDTWGWVAAALTAATIYAVQRARGSNRTCAVPRPDAERPQIDLTTPERGDVTSR
ncbi:MAG: hypothetical protein ACXVLK_20390 [Acidimicrobiales bacterium]